MIETYFFDKLDPHGHLCEGMGYGYPQFLHGDALRQRIAEVTRTWSVQEKLILDFRYAISDYRVVSYRKIGQQFGVSGETIRRREKKILEKLREPKHYRYLISNPLEWMPQL